MMPTHAVGSQCGEGAQIGTSCVALEYAAAQTGDKHPAMQINHLLV